MTENRFRALLLEQQEDGVKAAIRELNREALPPGDVLVSVSYSSLNYKDGLAVTNKGKVVRNYPMVPGIDLAGTVVESASPDFRPGDAVILTGWGVGEQHWGGFAQLARVKAGWLLPLPQGLSARDAMALGTAGLTAMLAVMALEEHGLRPAAGEVVVTGAAGGVGSLAVAILAHRGYRVVASTGRAELAGYLQELGAHRIVDRSLLASPKGRPLESEQWAGAVDTVGGDTLAGLLRGMAYGSSVAACGLAGGNQLHTTVFPFILRGVNLLGIDSVYCPNPRRKAAWERLTTDLPAGLLDRIAQVVPLSQVPELSEQIIRGQVRGRVVVDLQQG